MNRKLLKTLDKINHDMSLAELKRFYSHNKTNSLSYHDTLYLNIIEAHPNEYTSSQIADLLNITRPSVTQKINELVKKGYINRTQSLTDKRVFYLSINPESPRAWDVDRGADEEIERILFEKYGEANINLACDILEYVTELFAQRIKQGGEYE